ncbi:MAG: methylmalonyl Co-A mutase-associated GTPase MeaB [Pseudomonadota bacterium]
MSKRPPKSPNHDQTKPDTPSARNRSETLVDGLINGDRRAIAGAVTTLETFGKTAPKLLQDLQPRLGNALIVGFTGPPGAGKSTLVNALISHLRKSGITVAVIAVDPSSPVSGGAILGDRIRMTSALDDDGVFVRSLASGGALGGLSPAAVRIIDAFDAAKFDVIILETVGTGQTEIDVAEVADVRVVISAPGLGDGIQAMKAGLLEIADILVVNKADRDGAENTHQQLLAALSIRAPGSAKIPVIKTTATTFDGVPALWDEIARQGDRAHQVGPVERRHRRARYLIARAAADLVAQRIKDGAAHGLDKLADDVLTGQQSPMEAAELFLNSNSKKIDG